MDYNKNGKNDIEEAKSFLKNKKNKKYIIIGGFVLLMALVIIL